ncbi:unnamed protein product [Caretta caretta]
MADTAQNGPMQGGAGGGAVVARGVCFSLSFTIDFLRCVIPPVEIHTAGLFSQS